MVQHQIGFVGGGQMARALASGFVSAELIEAERIAVFDPVGAAAESFAALVPGARTVPSNVALAEVADVIILAVKPQHIDEAMAQLRSTVGPDKLVVSIAAGVTLARMAAGLGSERLVRVMPNTPCLVGQGASGYAMGPAAGKEDAVLVGRLLGSVGVAFELPEKLLDAVTGLSGSGPAYVYTMIEALSDGGVRMGLPRNVATALATQTVRGAASMVQASDEHPAVLRDRVTSPGGTTIAGLAELEKHGFRAALTTAVESATQRSQELGQ